jgi:uncharacterized spore protein YtfJ
MTDMNTSSALDKLGAIKDAMAVGRAFGDSYQVDGITVIPVASVRGGGGGGTGTGTGPVKDGVAGEKGSGSGAGMGFGATVRPIGVVVIQGGKVSWQPTVDVMRIILGAQILGLVAILTIRRIIERH